MKQLKSSFGLLSFIENTATPAKKVSLNLLPRDPLRVIGGWLGWVLVAIVHIPEFEFPFSSLDGIGGLDFGLGFWLVN